MSSNRLNPNMLCFTFRKWLLNMAIAYLVNRPTHCACFFRVGLLYDEKGMQSEITVHVLFTNKTHEMRDPSDTPEMSRGVFRLEKVKNSLLRR